MSFITRLRRAVAAFRAPIRERYAVIYDVLTWDGKACRYDSEEYYGYFATPAEARRMFTEAFGEQGTIHNAFLVKVLDQFKPRREDAP